ncbi:hypothetical protein AU192_13345 [Mycobacterium lehmannii]|uniref:Uncharacterized protein n=1 Tax=Mycobacterium lehmannii TaxID=2048550 RepID=A0A117JIB0_9MYCO|nr:hypothetical protein AU192_13345 [Mycobacterium lehmannii]
MPVERFGDFPAAGPLGALCYAAYHLLLHHEMRYVEPGMPDRATAAAHHKAGPSHFSPEHERPTARGLLAPLQPAEVSR